MRKTRICQKGQTSPYPIIIQNDRLSEVMNNVSRRFHERWVFDSFREAKSNKFKFS